MNGKMLIYLGFALMLLSFVYPMVTVIVDDTPPIIEVTEPEDGGVYFSVKTATLQVLDLESQIKEVGLTIYSPTGEILIEKKTPAGSNRYSITWSVDPEITTPGDGYKAVFYAINKAGLKVEQTNYFSIYTELQGKWYVAGQEVTSSTQTIYVDSQTVTFKFQKTAGVADESISCWVEEGGNRILTLEYKGNGVWEGSYTFSPGTHHLKLVASDQQNTVTMSIVDLDIPGGSKVPEWVNLQTVLMILGVTLIAYGLMKWRRR